MRTFTASVAIAAPPARVWDVMSDVERWHEWTPSIARIRRVGAGPFAVGSRAVVWQPRFPPALWTVTDLQPGRAFTWVSTAPGLRVAGLHRVEAVDGGARATLGVEIGGLFGGVWARLTGGLTERYIAMEAAGLKARSENPAFRRRT